MHWLLPTVFAAALVWAPIGAKAADLVVWWQKGAYAQEDAALREIIAAFEQGSGKQVELSLYGEDELPDALIATLETAQPPDFAFGFRLNDYISQWAFDDRLVDLTDTVGHFSDLFDRDALAWVTLLDEDRASGAVCAADRPRDRARPRVEEPPRAGWLYARRHSARMECVLVLLVQ